MARSIHTSPRDSLHLHSTPDTTPPRGSLYSHSKCSNCCQIAYDHSQQYQWKHKTTKTIAKITGNIIFNSVYGHLSTNLCNCRSRNISSSRGKQIFEIKWKKIIWRRHTCIARPCGRSNQNHRKTPPKIYRV